MKPVTTCLLLLNGNHARFVFQSGPGKRLETDGDKDILGPNLHGRDIQADRPGRTFDRMGQGRHAKEYATDPVRAVRREFLEKVAKELQREFEANDSSRLILAAPAKILDEFKSLLSPDLSDLVYAELKKDLTKIPIAQLPDHFDSVMLV